MDKIQLREKLIELTRDGPVSQWVDRIGQIALDIDLDPRYICWQGSPEMICYNLIKEATARDRLDDLNNLVKRLERKENV